MSDIVPVVKIRRRSKRSTIRQEDYYSADLVERWGYDDETRKPHIHVHQPPDGIWPCFGQEIDGEWWWCTRRSQ